MGGIISWLWRDPRLETQHNVDVGGTITTGHKVEVGGTINTGHKVEVGGTINTGHKVEVGGTINTGHQVETKHQFSFYLPLSIAGSVFGLFFALRFGIWLFYPPNNLGEFFAAFRPLSFLTFILWYLFRSGRIQIAPNMFPLVYSLTIFTSAVISMEILLWIWDKFFFLPHFVIGFAIICPPWLLQTLSQTIPIFSETVQILIAFRSKIFGRKEQIYVRTLTGNVFTINPIDLNDSIEVVKQKIHEKISFDGYELKWEGIQLENERKLLDYNINYESTLYLFVSCGRDWMKDIQIKEKKKKFSYWTISEEYWVSPDSEVIIFLESIIDVATPTSISNAHSNSFLLLTVTYLRNNEILPTEQTYDIRTNSITIRPIHPYQNGYKYYIQPSKHILPKENGTGIELNCVSNNILESKYLNQ